MTHKLTTRADIEKARSALSAKQLAFAEWLSVPRFERVPQTQKELAAKLNVAYRTLKNWKKMPEVWLIAEDINESELRELVPEARAVMEKAIRKPGSINRVSFDAAKHILTQWGESRDRTGGDVVRSIADMYKKYHPDTESQ